MIHTQFVSRQEPHGPCLFYEINIRKMPEFMVKIEQWMKTEY